MKKESLNKLALGLVLLIGLSSCRSCKTQPNANDNTPPTIQWTVRNQTTGQEQTVNGSGQLNYRHGDNLLITGCAIDDGGIKEIETYSVSGWSCTNGDLGQQVGPGLVVPETTPLGLDQEGLAWKRYCRFYEARLNFQCSNGFQFSQGTFTASMKGTNFGNLSTTGTLTLNVRP